MKIRRNIAIGTIVLLTLLYLMIAFYSVSFNIATWLEGARFAFCMIGIMIAFFGTLAIMAHANEN